MDKQKEKEFDLISDALLSLATVAVEFMEQQRLNCLTMTVGSKHILVLETKRKPNDDKEI
jgi:hypothetical protein